MRKRIISVGSGAYSGYSYPVLLESLAGCGITHVEPAFIQGYTDPFDETTFSLHHAAQINHWLQESGMQCYAFSAHMSLGRPDSLEIFRHRMDFARSLGAHIINTTAALKTDADSFFSTIEALARHAEGIGILIGLENPGDGNDNLFNTAQDGIDLVRKINHPNVTMNYDPGNVPSHFFGKIDSIQEGLTALPACAHMHIKDVRTEADGWLYPGITQGEIVYDPVMKKLAEMPDFPFSLEILPTLKRGRDAKPHRLTAQLPLKEIEKAINQSMRYIGKFMPV